DEPCSKFSRNASFLPANRSYASENVQAGIDALEKHWVLITAHDHCYAPQDFIDSRKGHITVRTIKLTTDNTYWTGGVAVRDCGPLKDCSMGGEKDLSQDASRAIELLNRPGVKIVRHIRDIENLKDQDVGAIISFEGGSVLPRASGCEHPQEGN